MEPVIREQQNTARREAAAHDEVAWAHSVHREDWLAYFLTTFQLEEKFELWNGASPLGNVDVRPLPQKGIDCISVWSLRKSSLDAFAAEARATTAPAGIVTVFRSGPADKEPFGVWFAWLCIGDFVLVADLQNSCVSDSLAGAVARLGWEEAPRHGEVFYAPMRPTP